MKKLFYLIFVCLLLTLTACTSTKKANHMDICYGYDKSLLIVSTDDNETILQMLDIINNYQEFGSTVAINDPDYIIKLSPTDSSNSSKEYKLWIKDDKIIYLSPQLFDESPKLLISKHLSDDFLKILNKNNS